MAFKLKVSNEKVEGMDVMPAGPYEYRFVGFKPAKSKDGNSINLNATMVIINHPEFTNRKVFDTLNTGGAFTWPDFAHALGVVMETDGKDSWFPGDWDGDPSKYKEEDPATWVYKGPLLNRTGKFELAVDNYNGRDNNKIRRYFCAIPDCAQKFPKIRHQEDLLRKSSK